MGGGGDLLSTRTSRLGPAAGASAGQISESLIASASTVDSVRCAGGARNRCLPRAAVSRLDYNRDGVVCYGREQPCSRVRCPSDHGPTAGAPPHQGLRLWAPPASTYEACTAAGGGRAAPRPLLPAPSLGRTTPPTARRKLPANADSAPAPRCYGCSSHAPSTATRRGCRRRRRAFAGAAISSLGGAAARGRAPPGPGHRRRAARDGRPCGPRIDEGRICGGGGGGGHCGEDAARIWSRDPHLEGGGWVGVTVHDALGVCVWGGGGGGAVRPVAETGRTDSHRHH